MKYRGEKRLLLESGNIYSFAHILLDTHPTFCRDNNFGFKEAINSYRKHIEFNDGIYTFRADNGKKYFFDTEMNFRGGKQ